MARRSLPEPSYGFSGPLEGKPGVSLIGLGRPMIRALAAFPNTGNQALIDYRDRTVPSADITGLTVDATARPTSVSSVDALAHAAASGTPTQVGGAGSTVRRYTIGAGDTWNFAAGGRRPGQGLHTVRMEKSRTEAIAVAATTTTVYIDRGSSTSGGTVTVAGEVSTNIRASSTFDHCDFTGQLGFGAQAGLVTDEEASKRLGDRLPLRERGSRRGVPVRRREPSRGTCLTTGSA